MIELNKCVLSKTGNVITARAKLSYPTLFVPRAMAGAAENAEKKYSTSILLPPTADITLLKDAAAKTAREKWGADLPRKMKSPFLKAGEIEGAKGPAYPPEYADWIVIRTTSKQKPGVVDARGVNVDDEAEVYAGRWARVSLRAFAYDTQGNRGVSFGLQNVQLLDHDTPIAGARVKAEDEFEAVATGDGGTGSADDMWA